MTLDEFVVELEAGLRPSLPPEVLPQGNEEESNDDTNDTNDKEGKEGKQDAPEGGKKHDIQIPAVSTRDYAWLYHLVQGGWQFKEYDRLSSAQLAQALEEYCMM